MGNCIRSQDRPNQVKEDSRKPKQQDDHRTPEHSSNATRKTVDSPRRRGRSSESSDQGAVNGTRPQAEVVHTESSATQENTEEPEELPQWNFPPTLDDFNLMECEEDPARLEEIFNDDRLVEVQLILSHGQGLGLTIVGGKDSQSGDVPIYIKRIFPSSVLEKDGKLKTGDELIAVNEILLVNVTKEYASDILNKVEGNVRLLALQDL